MDLATCMCVCLFSPFYACSSAKKQTKNTPWCYMFKLASVIYVIELTYISTCYTEEYEESNKATAGCFKPY